MIVNVHMTIGGIVFQFPSRKEFRRAIDREPTDNEPALRTFVRSDLTDGWVALRAVYIRKHSVAFVVDAEAVAKSDDDLPAKGLRDERAAAWRERQEAEEVTA